MSRTATYHVTVTYRRDAKNYSEEMIVEASSQARAHLAAVPQARIGQGAHDVSVDVRREDMDADTTLAYEQSLIDATVYVKTQGSCPACDAVLRWCKRHDLHVDVVPIENHPHVVDRARDAGNTSAPVVVWGDNAEHIFGGYKIDELAKIVAHKEES